MFQWMFLFFLGSCWLSFRPILYTILYHLSFLSISAAVYNVCVCLCVYVCVCVYFIEWNVSFFQEVYYWLSFVFNDMSKQLWVARPAIGKQDLVGTFDLLNWTEYVVCVCVCVLVCVCVCVCVCWLAACHFSCLPAGKVKDTHSIYIPYIHAYI